MQANNTDYFNSEIARRLEQDQRAGISSKLIEVQAASAEKVSGLQQLAAERRAIERKNRLTAAGLMGYDINSIEGKLTNAYAAGISGASRLLGHTLSIPDTIDNAYSMANADTGAVEARNRFKQGLASADDMALLNKKVYTLNERDTPEQQTASKAILEASPGIATNMEWLDRAEAATKSSRATNEKFDISSLIQTDARDAFAKELTTGGAAPMDQYLEGSRQQADGDILKGTGNVIQGLAGLIFNAGAAAVNNKEAVLSYAIENAPQLLIGLAGKAGGLALGVTNAGYAMDTYQQGIQAYADKNNGAMPSDGDRQKMAWQAASLAAAEQAGDMVGLAAMKGAGKAVAAISAREALKNSLLRTGGAVGKGLASEAPTEGYQTFMEGEITGKPASAMDIYTGATIGGLSGGVLSGGGHVVSELAGSTEYHQEVRKQAILDKTDLLTAVKDNDPSQYLDQTNRNYSLSKAVAVLGEHAKQADTTPEVRQANLAKIDTILQEAQDKREDAISELEFLAATPEKKAEDIARIQDTISKLPADDTESLEIYQSMLAKKQELLAPVSKRELAKRAGDIAAMTKEVAVMQRVNEDTKNSVVTKEAVQEQISKVSKPVNIADPVAVEAAVKEADKLITLSMRNPVDLSPEQALAYADDKANGMTPTQKDYFRTFSAARIAENSLKNGNDVSQEVLYGSPKEKGISKFRSNIMTALNAGNLAAAKEELSKLAYFGQTRQEKVGYAEDVFSKTVQGKVSQHMFDAATKSWKLVNGKSDADMKANGGMTISTGSYEKLIVPIQNDAAAIASAVAEMKAAIAYHTGKPVVTPAPAVAPIVAPVVTAPSKTVTAATEAISTVSKSLLTTADKTRTKVTGPMDPKVSEESANIATLLGLLGVPVTTGSYTELPSEHDLLTAQKRVIEIQQEVQKTPGSLDKYKTELGTLLGQLRQEGVVDTERADRATKGAVKHGKDNPSAHLVLQLAEELNELVEEINRVNGKTSANDQLSLQKRAMKVLRFGEDTPVKTDPNKKTNRQLFEIAQAKVTTPTAPKGNSNEKAPEAKQAAAKQPAQASETVKPLGEDIFTETARLDEIVETKEDIKQNNKYLKRLENPRNSLSLWSVLKHSLNVKEVGEIYGSDAKRYNLLKAKKGTNGTDLTTSVSNGVLDAFLPAGFRKIDIDSGRITDQQAVEKIIEKLRGRNYLTDETNLAIRAIGETINSLEKKLSLLEIEQELDYAEAEAAQDNQSGNPEAQEDTSQAEDGDTAAPVRSQEETASEPVKPTEKEHVGLGVLHPSNKSGPDVEYNKRNLLADHLKQTDGTESHRPLVGVKDFIKRLFAKENGVLPSSFIDINALGEPTKEQKRWLKFFHTVANNWDAAFQSDLIPTPTENLDYRYRDPMSFLMEANEQGSYSVESNVTTAMSYGAIDLILSLHDNGEISNPRIINGILDRDSKAELFAEAYELLGSVGLRDTKIHQSAGKTAAQALGFKNVNGDTPLNLLPQLEASFGEHIVQMLLKRGILKEEKISDVDLGKVIAMGKELDGFEDYEAKVATNERRYHSFISLNRENEEVQKIIEMSEGNGGILDKMMSVEGSLKYPDVVPIVSTQSSTKTGQELPGNLVGVVDQNRKQETFARKDLWNVLRLLWESNPAIVDGIAGIEEVTKENTQINQFMSRKAKMDGLKREVTHYIGYMSQILDVGLDGISRAIFFDYSIWTPNRVGIATNIINQQSSKVHRPLFYRKDWESTVKLDDAAMMSNFYLRVGEGMGVKTERGTVVASLAKIKDMFFGESETAVLMNAAIEVLRKMHYEGYTEPTDKEQATLLKAVQTGKQNTHSLDALMAMAHFAEVKRYNENNKDKKESFVTHIVSEVDGVTNGPVLGHLLYGAAPTSDKLAETVARGGFYSVDSSVTEFNEWIANPRNKDMYEHTYRDVHVAVLAQIEKKRSEYGDAAAQKSEASLDSVQYFSGSLVTGTGEDLVTSSDGRTIIKPPVTEMMFGSSTGKSITNMANIFLENVFARMAKAALSDNQTDRDDVVRHINNLLVRGFRKGMESGNKLNGNTDLLKHVFTENDKALIKNSFKGVFENPIKAVMGANFETFAQNRTLFTQVSEMTYGIYTAVYNAARNQLIQELINLRPGHPNYHNRIRTVMREGVETPIRDLTKNEENILTNRLKGMAPVMHTLFSKENDQLGAGLAIGKSSVQTNNAEAYSVSTQHRALDGSRYGVNTQGASRISESPGVAMVPLSIHSTDSYTSHMAQLERQLLNVHDAVAAGLMTIHDAAIAINKATWNAMVKYSPMAEMNDALMRTLSGLENLIKRDVLPLEAAANIQEFLMEFDVKNKGSVISINYLYSQARAAETKATETKLAVLGNTGYVNQYARENGSYAVTPEDHKEVAKKLAELENNALPTDEQNATIAFIEEKLAEATGEIEKLGGVKALRRAADISQFNALGLDTLSISQASEILTTMSNDTRPEKNGGVKKSNRILAEAVRNEMGSTNSSLLNAMLSQLKHGQFAGIVQGIKQRMSTETVWGTRGVPKTDPNPAVEAFFSKEATATGAEVVAFLKDLFTKKLQADEKDSSKAQSEFMLKLLEKLKVAIPANTKVTYITPGTKPENVVGGVVNGSRGWHQSTASGSINEIYVLSSDFVESGLNAELLAHELIHSALQDAITNPTEESKVLIAELTSLLDAARKSIEGKETLQTKHAEALSSLQEFVSWGLTNRSFQLEVLNPLVYTEKTTKKTRTGMAAFIASITGFFFRSLKNQDHDKAQDGMSVFIANVSGLLDIAGENNTSGDPAFSIGKDGLIKGVTFKDAGVVVLNKSLNLTPRQLHALKLHEIGVHYGLERMIGKEAFDALLVKMQGMWGKSASVDKAYASVPADTPAHLIHEEALAYMVENYHNAPMVQRILSAIKEWFLKTFGRALPFERDAYVLATAALAEYKYRVRVVFREDIQSKPKEGFVKLNFDSALTSAPEMHTLLDTIVDGLGTKVALTGSLSLSLTKPVYRSKDEQIHDLDFVYTGGDSKTLAADLKTLLPSADLLRVFYTGKDKSLTVTVVVPSPGVTALSVAYTQDKKSFVVLGSVKGQEPRVLKDTEYNAADFFINEQAKENTLHEYTGVDGVKRTVALQNTDDTFTAKLAMARPKDVNDALIANYGNPALSTTGPSSYSTIDLYDGLVSPTNPMSSTFDAHLKGLLENIVEKIHGPFSSLMAQRLKNSPLSAIDAFAESVASGEAPFASKVMASPLKVSDQEAFVIEQIEATLQIALSEKSAEMYDAYRELDKLFEEQRKRLTPESFHKGPWATATPDDIALATSIRDFIFSMDPSNGTRQEQLARFVALGLGHQEFNKLLKVKTTPTAKSTDSLLKRIFDTVLGWFNGKMTNTFSGQVADEKINVLLDQLVRIEQRRRERLIPREASIFNNIGDSVDRASDAVRSKVEKLGRSAFFKESKYSFVKLAGSATSMVAGYRTMLVIGGLRNLRDETHEGRNNFAVSLIDYTMGPAAFAQKLLRATKMNERMRMFASTETASTVLGSFVGAGEYLTKESKKAITNVLLRTGAFTLLEDYGVKGIATLVSDKAELQKEIAALEKQLNQFPARVGAYYRDQAIALGYYFVTNKAKTEHLLLNAKNIAGLVGTPFMGKLSDKQTKAAEAILDKLSTLHGIYYSSSVDLVNLSKVMDVEAKRKDAGNGIEMTLLTQQALDKQSKEDLFAGSERLMAKGHTPEILNPYTGIKVVNEEEGADLVLQGYSKGDAVGVDPNDPDQSLKHIYVLRDGAEQPLLSGSLSLTSMHAKGSLMEIDEADVPELKRRKLAALRASFKPGPRLDPLAVDRNYMVPVINKDGFAVKYRYLMHASTKDGLMERNNNFEEILGTLASNIYDKVSSVVQNKNVIEAMYAHYKQDFVHNPVNYVKVGHDSNSAEMREIYRMLPTKTKEDIKRVWGTTGMLVPTDLIDITFGYRKHSLSTIFDSPTDQRNWAEKSFATTIEWALESYAIYHLNMTDEQAQKYARRASVYVRKSEHVWQALIQEMKANFVVKSLSTLTGNIFSNLTLTYLYGVPFADNIKNTALGLRSITRYLSDQKELERLRIVTNAGYVTGDVKEQLREIARLEESMARNPVHPLMVGGLLPSIVEDASSNDDPYGYKHIFIRKTEKYTNKLNPTVRAVGNTLLVTKDTTLYKMMYKTTQLSDFVARFVLYQHLTTKAKKPMTHDEIIQECSDAFINYDIPMPKGLQYTDDMGITIFSKYFYSIQRVLYSRMKEEPARVLALTLAHNYLDLLPTVMASSAYAHLGNVPLQMGILNVPGSFGNIAPIKLIGDVL